MCVYESSSWRIFVLILFRDSKECSLFTLLHITEANKLHIHQNWNDSIILFILLLNVEFPLLFEIFIHLCCFVFCISNRHQQNHGIHNNYLLSHVNDKPYIALNKYSSIFIWYLVRFSWYECSLIRFSLLSSRNGKFFRLSPMWMNFIECAHIVHWKQCIFYNIRYRGIFTFLCWMILRLWVNYDCLSRIDRHIP